MLVVRVVGSRQETAPIVITPNGSTSRQFALPPGELLEEIKVFDMSKPFTHVPDEVMRQVYSMCRTVAALDRRQMYASMLEEGGALAWLGGWKSQYVEAMAGFIDPYDHKQDRTFKFGLYPGDDQDRYFEWAPWNIEGCDALDIFREGGFDISVHSLLPRGSAYLKTVEEFDPSAAANYESSPAEFIYGACKLQKFNQSYHHQFEEMPVWRNVEQRGLKSPTKHKMSLTHKALATVPGTYDWWMWNQIRDNTNEMDWVVAVLGGNGSICWIPVTILLPIYG